MSSMRPVDFSIQPVVPPYASVIRTRRESAAERARGSVQEPVVNEPVQPARPVKEVVAARSRLRVGDDNSPAQRTLYYTNDDTRFTSFQRKALNAYAANQNLSQMDPHAEYLGAIDTYA
ncbi:Hypothetical protein HDN1F_28500 [gamma proteobacterium HdN1]|nr:Hypothetical protein HDN1F_28500 [gamma proteobacterium HdN1]